MAEIQALIFFMGTGKKMRYVRTRNVEQARSDEVTQLIMQVIALAHKISRRITQGF